MSSGGDIPDTYTTTTRYAEYIENAHQAMMWSAYNYREYLWDKTPFDTFSVVNPVDAFFMAGYYISDYPTVYDMYGKFMAGLDIEVLWNQIHSDSAYGAVISEIINADSNILEDELDEQTAELFAQARTINAVMTSSFIIAEGNMRSKKVYAVAKELADLRAKFSELAQRRWESHLDWNIKAIDAFLRVNELFFNLQTKYLQDKTNIDVSNLLWPFTLLDHERSIVASLQGAVTSETKGPKRDSGWSQAANIMGMAAGGLEMIAGLAAIPFVSDVRLKKFIREIKGVYNAIGLKCYRWVWNKKAEKLFGLSGFEEGVIAQEVMKKYPHAVIKENGFYKVKYGLLDNMLSRG